MESRVEISLLLIINEKSKSEITTTAKSGDGTLEKGKSNTIRVAKRPINKE